MTDAGTLKVTTPSDREVAMARAFDAPREAVFGAWTRPELLRRWLTGPPGWSLAVCEIDLRVGGASRFAWRGADGTEMGLRGVYREVSPPGRVAHAELFDVDWTGGETLVTTALVERDGGTTATIAILYASREARDAALGTAWRRAWRRASTGSRRCWRRRRETRGAGPEASASRVRSAGATPARDTSRGRRPRDARQGRGRAERRTGPAGRRRNAEACLPETTRKGLIAPPRGGAAGGRNLPTLRMNFHVSSIVRGAVYPIGLPGG